MVHDVENIAVWRSDEEPSHTPGLCRQRVDDLVTELLRLLIGAFDIVGVNGNDRVLGCGCVTRDEAYYPGSKR